MREILFRGKKEKDSAWVYGGFGNDILGGTGPYIVNFIADDNSGILISPEDFSSLHFVSVLPETVGQYTGLTDRNGEKIFEGDIVADFRGVCGVVTFCEGTFDSGIYQYIGWAVKNLDGDVDHTPLIEYEEDFDKLFVVGNIHDNPELLRGNGK